MDEIQIPSSDDVSKVVESASNFAEMIGRVFPGLSQRSMTRAQKKATSAMMHDIERMKAFGEEVGLSTQTVEALCDDIVRRHARNERFENVVQFAQDRLPDDFEPKADLDEEWAENFRDQAEKAADEEAQKLWGAILAQEAQEPGTVSKRTMRILADMSRAEALSFKRLCGFATKMHIEGEPPEGHYDPFIVLCPDKGSAGYNNGALMFRELTNLANIGLVDRSVSYRLVAPVELGCPIEAGDYVVVLEAPKGASPLFNLTEGVFTACGKQLSRICGIGGDPGLADAIEALAKQKGLSAERYRMPQQAE